jgi:hypothetical protein
MYTGIAATLRFPLITNPDEIEEVGTSFEAVTIALAAEIDQRVGTIGETPVASADFI